MPFKNEKQHPIEPMNQNCNTIVMSASIAIALTSGAMAATVSVDLQGFNGQGTYAGTTPAPAAGTTWNGREWTNNSFVENLLDSQGGVSDIGIFLQGNPGEWGYASAANALMGDYTFTNTAWANNAGQRFTIFSDTVNGGAGMQLDGAKTYDIYIYTMGDAANQHGIFQLNSAAASPTILTATGDGPFTGTFVEGSNYLKFSNVSPKAYANGFEFEFWWGRDATSTAAAINGFQIVEVVPEPATSLIGALGMLVLFRRRR